MDIYNLNSSSIPERRARDAKTDAGETSAQQVTSERRPAVRSDAASAGTASRSRDEVQLSSQARLLKRAESQAAEGEAFDGARVEAIRNAIAQGRYPIDAERLAQRVLDLEIQLDQ
ncbi:MAG: flagellar biosynthesis anti-sigma factor FlgM [Pseudomonadales bacterium]